MIGIYAIRNTKNSKMYIGDPLILKSDGKVTKKIQTMEIITAINCKKTMIKAKVKNLDSLYQKNLYFHLMLKQMQLNYSLYFIVENTII